MKLLCLMMMLLGTCAIGLNAQTPVQRTTPGPVMKVWYQELKPGKANDYRISILFSIPPS